MDYEFEKYYKVEQQQQQYINMNLKKFIHQIKIQLNQENNSSFIPHAI